MMRVMLQMVETQEHRLNRRPAKLRILFSMRRAIKTLLATQAVERKRALPLV